jgi:hypothetical protein
MEVVDQYEKAMECADVKICMYIFNLLTVTYGGAQ